VAEIKKIQKEFSEISFFDKDGYPAEERELIFLLHQKLS
jgi:hypothetical protein